MLTRFHKILIALLALQLILIVVVMVRGEDTGALKEHPVLAGFDAAKVTRLQVFANATATPVDLVKRDASWVLASGFDYPVAETKVTDALAPIAKVSAAAPIATQSGRHKQLHVADDDFERKLVITRDGKDITLLIGSSVGSRRTAVRLGGDVNVYGVTGLSSSQIAGEARLWVDPAYLKIPSAEIAQVTIQRDGKTVQFVRSAPPAPAASGSGSAGSAAGSGSNAGSAAPSPEHWEVMIGAAPPSLAAGESLDQAAIERLVGQVATLDLSAPGDPKRDATKPTATITVERKAKDATTPAPTIIDVIADGESYWVHDRSLPRAALVDKGRIDGVLEADRDKVVKKPPPPPPPVPAPGAAAGSAARPGAGPAARPGAGSAAQPTQLR